MGTRSWLKVAVLFVLALSDRAAAQDAPSELTPLGKAILQAQLAQEGRPLYDRPGPTMPLVFPLAMCTFPSGLCGAVRRDGSIAVAPRYDWVGIFSYNRAAVRVAGLYGFVDEDGREIVKPQYRVADDYKFGFAQVEVDGKSGLIDRDGKMIFAPTYGFIEAIGPDRFRVSDFPQRGGTIGSEDFSGLRATFTADSISVSMPEFNPSGVIDLSGQWITPPGPSTSSEFDKANPSLRWVERDGRWGLLHADGNWLVEPTFQRADALSDGLARVTLDGKVGFIDSKGTLAIAPVFDKAGEFRLGLGRTWAQRDGSSGVIDTSGSWVFRTDYQQIRLVLASNKESPFWQFEQAGHWGLLDLDGRVVLGADFDQAVDHCGDKRLIAYKKKEWLYFAEDGSPLQPPEGRLIDATCGRAPPYILKIGDKYRLVDAHSAPVTSIEFDAVTRAALGTRNVKVDRKWGRIRPDGSWLIEPRFDYLSSDADPFVAAIDGKRGVMRADGSWLIEPKFDAARIRTDGTAFVTISNATGVLRLSDQSWIVRPRSGVMCDIGNAIMSQAGGKRVILSPAGDVWIDTNAERIGVNLEFGLLTFLRNDKWGLVDTAGHVMVEPEYDEPVYFGWHNRGIAWAKQGGKWCAIDRRGHPIPGIACSDTNPMGSPGLRFECKIEP